MHYLALVNIGPVQDFIAAARRTRDLWFGSWLLSELAKTVAKSLVDQQANLIFPAPHNPATDLAENSPFNVPNKTLLTITTDNLTDVMEKAQEALFERLHAIREDSNVWQHLDEQQKQIAVDQIDDLIEYIWVALPYDGRKYSATRTTLESLMAARKNTRNFQPVDWGNTIPKSSIDGSRESVIPEEMYPKQGDSDAVRSNKIKALYAIYRAGQGERLSGVDLLKRHGNKKADDSTFPSTSHIAALPFFAYLKRHSHGDAEKALKVGWDTYTQQINRKIRYSEQIPERFADDLFGRSDGSLLFTERLAEGFDTTQSNERKELNHIRGYLVEFLEAYGNKNQPSPYYAILHADGDAMGKVIDAIATQGFQKHQDFSKKLAEFATSVRAIVEDDHFGALIYAGGDDVLAFLPLHTVLQCANELRLKFVKILADSSTSDGITPTLSVGIAIVHHLEPLSDGLNLARQAEKAAKGEKGKNALAIVLSKRGGEDRIIRGAWNIDVTKAKTLYERLQTLWIPLHCQNSLPDGYAYELRDLAIRLPNATANLLVAESIRILKRKRRQHGIRAIDEKTINEIRAILQNLVYSASDLAELAEEIVIANEFAKAHNLAFGTGGVTNDSE